MPTQRPTLPQLIEQGAAEFESRLPGVLARLRNSVIGVINRVLAGALSALYKYADRLNDQMWPDTADADELPAHGARWGKTRLAAAKASGAVQFTGANGAGIPSATVVKRTDGTQYVTTAAGVIAGGLANVPALAVEPGQLGNAVADTVLQLTSPLDGVNSATKAATAMAGGSDVESIEAWRARILARIRQTPQAGADYDYVQWALEVPGVTRAWPYPREQGAGTVVVRFVRDDDVSLIPDAGEVATVQAYLDARCPATATVYVVAPIAAPQAFTIALLPDTAAIRAAVEAELRALYRREAKPGGTMLITQQREAISVAAGEIDHVLTVPSANQPHATGLLPTLGVITWV